MASALNAVSTVYVFKAGAHAPSGVTPEGIEEERQRIANEYGKATVDHAALAVMSEPEKYPHTRAWGPTDPEEAFREGIKRGIRHAWASVIPIHLDADGNRIGDAEPRRYHVVVDADGDRVYAELEEIKVSHNYKQQVIADLRKRVADLHKIEMDTLAEFEDVVS